jgi:hypothetical protein
MTYAAIIIEAYKAGKKARQEERVRTPALDPQVHGALEFARGLRKDAQGSATIDVLDAWLKGWDEVHFAEVFPNGSYA